MSPPLVRLLGNARALGDDFHITTDRAFTWNEIHEAIARGLGVEAIHAHVPTETLVRFDKSWEGPLMGDKTWSALFDNSKVKGVAGDFHASRNIDEILADSIMHAKERLKAPASAASMTTACSTASSRRRTPSGPDLHQNRGDRPGPRAGGLASLLLPEPASGTSAAPPTPAGVPPLAGDRARA